MTETNFTPVKRVKPTFLLGYYLVHLFFCTGYFLLLWLGGGTVGLVILAFVIVVTTIWATRYAWKLRQVCPLPPYAAHPALVALVCLLGWPFTFSLYLTYRQWLRQRANLRGHGGR